MTPETSRGGQPGRSGPPGNSNARKTGALTVRRERKEVRQRAINGRTAEGRYVADQRGDLIASLGGADNLSTQQGWLVEEGAFLRLELAYVRTWLAMQSPINKRKRAAHPILKDYIGLVNALRGVLGDLGLARKAREVPSLETYLRERSANATTAPPAPAPTAAQANASPCAGNLPGAQDAVAGNLTAAAASVPNEEP